MVTRKFNFISETKHKALDNIVKKWGFQQKRKAKP